MKHLLLTTIAAVLVVGCGGPSAPDISNVIEGIHFDASYGNIEAVKQHIAAGTDVNAKGDAESTPLHWAANGGHKEIVELLITEGADVNAKDNRLRKTPLDLAIGMDRTETADVLRKHGGKTGEELKAEAK